MALGRAGRCSLGTMQLATVSAEYVALAERRNFSRRELVELAENGFRVALLHESVKQRYYEDLDAMGKGLAGERDVL